MRSRRRARPSLVGALAVALLAASVIAPQPTAQLVGGAATAFGTTLGRAFEALTEAMVGAVTVPTIESPEGR